MFWVIQEDLFQENGRQVLINTLEKFSIPYEVVKIVPFSHELIPEITQEGNIVTNGSILLSKIANERGWKPGAFLNENFDYRVWFPYYKKYLLNRDAIFTTVRDANPLYDDVFVRPVLDDKSFNGIVLDNKEFIVWKKEILAGNNNFVKPDTEIIYNIAKNIGQEHRHFIIDGKVITSSRYKLNGRTNYSEDVDDYVIKFAENMASIFSPARAFVMDTYITNEEIGIVEIGCICNAGFYKADIQKLVMNLNFMDL